jgi:hypothetical protein
MLPLFCPDDTSMSWPGCQTNSSAMTNSLSREYLELFQALSRVALLINRLALARLQRQHRFDLWHGVVTYPTGVCLINWQEHAASKASQLLPGPERGR